MFIATNGTNFHEWLLRNLGNVATDNTDHTDRSWESKIRYLIRGIRAIRGNFFPLRSNHSWKFVSFVAIYPQSFVL